MRELEPCSGMLTEGLTTKPGNVMISFVLLVSVFANSPRLAYANKTVMCNEKGGHCLRLGQNIIGLKWGCYILSLTGQIKQELSIKFF